MGEILRSKVIRAVGSVLGLKENLAGSAAYTAEQVKSVAWLKQHGYTGSIMIITRIIMLFKSQTRWRSRELMPRIGDYDCLAIEWGYREFPASKNAYTDREVYGKVSEMFSGIYVSRITGIEVRAGDLSSEPLKTLGFALNNLLRLNEALGNIVYSDKRYDSG